MRFVPWAVLVFALIFPSVMGWLDYVVVPADQAGPNRATQIAYWTGKLIQFGLPVVFVTWTAGRFPWPGLPSFGGLRLGLAFGLVVGLGTVVLYYVFLRDTSVFRNSPEQVREKLAEFGLNSPAGFIFFAVFVTLAHSLLEEYYWRWFVFGELRRRATLPIAMALSSFAFGAFHIFPLNTYLPGHFLSAV